MLKRTLYIRNGAENIRTMDTRKYAAVSGGRVLFMAGRVISRKIFAVHI